MCLSWMKGENVLKCRKILNKRTDPVTGEQDAPNYVDPYISNSANACAHFKKRFFVKGHVKKYCTDCKHSYEDCFPWYTHNNSSMGI